MAAVDSPDRRRFHVVVIYGLWSLISGALSVPAFIYLFWPPIAKKKEDWVEVGDLAQLPERIPEERSFQRMRKDGWKLTSEKASVLVTRTSNNEVVAFSPVCTHLGCSVRWAPDRDSFYCPCHNSTFAVDGKVTGGPAPRPLDRYEVKVEKGKIFVGHEPKT